MKKILQKTLENHSLLYKALLYITTIVVIVFLLPKNSKFKFDFQKGKPWQYESYYAPFDFSILKSSEEISTEKKLLKENAKQYFYYDKSIVKSIETQFKEKVNLLTAIDSLKSSKQKIYQIGKSIIDKIYKNGYIDVATEERFKSIALGVNLRKENVVLEVTKDNFISASKLLPLISAATLSLPTNDQITLMNIVSEIVKPNVFFDEKFTQKSIEEAFKKISYTKGFIAEKERIVLKGDIVEGRKLAALNSIKKEYESQVWSKSNYAWIVVGYSILVALALLMLLLFLRKYRFDIFENNNKVTFIFFNVVVMISLVTIVLRYNIKYVYVVPLVMLPLVLKAFFDARLGLFTHVLTILIIGFIVPHNFEFIFLQIIAGIVTILTISELHKRANLFISVAQITGIYFLTYFAFYIIQEGNLSNIKWENFGYFILNGVAALFVLPLIYVYEKMFNLVSDESLKELSNTNSTLLRELAEKAPGTFQHSLQVANLAEAVANEIDANAMLVRTGALYHDIGKMKNPLYFIENQTTTVNPHNELLPYDSAKIIIDHVIDGIEIAKKHKIPDRIIDFIRTHHGTSLVYYFYKKASEDAIEEVDVSKFQYPGPIPFSKETSILMMCDAVEAASRSVKEPTAEIMSALVEKIVNKQMKEQQFMNADVTFKELQTVKKVLKKKLMNIYHLRVEYPE